MMQTFYSESQAELNADIPCFDPFSCETTSDRRDVADTYTTPIVWCHLSLVSHAIQADPAAMITGKWFQVAFPR
jgi:hypothetical protein